MDLEFDRTRLIDLLKRDALRVGTFTLASGKTSHYYVDGRKVTLSAEGASAVAEGVLAVLDGRPEVEAVGGLTMGADPIVGATLALAGLRGRPLLGFLVRKEPKGHGTGQLVEGPLGRGQVVAILEDVATTGGSALKAVDAVEAMGARVGCVITMLDRLEGAAAAFEARGLDFYALATVRDLGVEPIPMHPGVDELPEILG
jgi:orotate phosphoribosyltransferase